MHAYTHFAVRGGCRLHCDPVGASKADERPKRQDVAGEAAADGAGGHSGRHGELMAKVQDIQVLLVRCGATSWEVGGRLCGGGTDLSLCEEGRKAMVDITGRLHGTTLGLVACAGDAASQETGQLVAGATVARLKTIEALREVHMGLWEGLHLAELEERFPSVYRQWKVTPEGVLVPQGESIEEARQRLIEGIAKVLTRSRGISKGVGFVLRPLAYLVVRSWIRGEPLESVWAKPEQIPDMEWHCVPRLKLRGNGPIASASPSSRAKAS